MKFSEVLEQMINEGSNSFYYRKGWFSPRKEIFLVDQTDYEINNPSLGRVNKHRWIAITNKNEVFPYLPDSEDMFADDWESNDINDKKVLDTQEETDISNVQVTVKNNNSIDPSIFSITEI